MIVDTSAIIAIVANEPEQAEFMAALRSTSTRMSAATYLEAAIVIDRRQAPGLGPSLDRLITRLTIAIVAVTEQQARIARQAYRDFGKGSGHLAQLNFGDCFAFALAQDTGEPLLYKGDDFTRAGVRSALAAQQT